MKVSKKSDYAMRALVYLALKSQDGPVSIRVIAEENDIPKRFLEQIMLDLREQAWVSAIPGRVGGYQLAVSPDALTMGQVIRHYDGILAPINCVSLHNYEQCSQETRCLFRRTFLEIRNYTINILDKRTLADLIREKPLTSQELARTEYIHGGGI
jgi:Rrf2 family protein